MFPLINFLEVVEDHLEIETQEDIMHVFYVLRQPLQTLFHIKSYGLLQLLSVPSPPLFIQLKNLFKHDFLIMAGQRAFKYLGGLKDVMQEHLVENCHLFGFFEFFLCL